MKAAHVHHDTFNALSLASDALDELMQLLADHPRVDVMARAEFARRECLKLTNAAVQARRAAANS